MTEHKNNLRAKLKDPRFSGFFHLMVVYVVWSSTYLAIRIGVQEGAGFTPAALGTMRVLTAGILLLLWAKLRGDDLKLSKPDFRTLLISSLFLWLGGNGLVMVAEVRVDSNLAALLVAFVPIWSAMIEMFIDRKRPSMLFIFSLLVGFGGISLLTVPTMVNGVRADVLAMIALLAGALFWAIGSVIQSHNKPRISPFVSAGYQMLFGGLGFGMIWLISGDPLPTPTTEAWLTLLYLIFAGSMLAFTSYITALQRLKTSIVMTYAYVNPVLAVILGWMILNEQISWWTVGGGLLVLLGVWGIFRERFGEN